MRYIFDELWLALLYTTLLTIMLEFTIHFVFTKKNARKNLKLKEEELAEKISTTFIFSRTDALNYFYNIASINFSAKKTSKYVVVFDRKETPNSIQSIIYPNYSYSPITPQNLVEMLNDAKKHDCEKIIICGYKIDKDTYKLAEKIEDKKIILLDSLDAYLKISKYYNIYPSKLKLIKSIDKLTFKDILKASLSRKNSKGFLVSSLILLISSFIVQFNIYYIIISSVLLLFSLLSFFLPQKPKLMEDPIF